MRTLVGCPMILGGIVCLLVGLVLGMRSLFVIRQSQGQLRGYPLAITSIVVGFVMLVVGPLVVRTIRITDSGVTQSYSEWHGRPWRGDSPKVSRAYSKLVTEIPPLDWFQGSLSARRIPGAASVGEENMQLQDTQAVDRIVERVGFAGFQSENIIEVTLRNLREKGTDAPLVIWIAEVDSDVQPEESDFARKKPGEYILKKGRIYFGVYTERPPFGAEMVNRLGDHYAERLKAIELDRRRDN